MKIDLHMHSNISNDGEFSPKELVEMCSSAGINVMALADHNSVRGVKEALEYGKEKNIKVISAVELDCTHGEHNLHILGYNIDVENIWKNRKRYIGAGIKCCWKKNGLCRKSRFYFWKGKNKGSLFWWNSDRGDDRGKLFLQIKETMKVFCLNLIEMGETEVTILM